VWAAVVGLLNDARLRAGKKPLGFLNPWLYKTGYTGLTDITSGAGVGCDGVNGQTGEPVPGGGIVPGAYWNATKGWDPVTGLGVPDFQKLKTLVLALK
jgi:tripeptidyl-peptidase I